MGLGARHLMPVDQGLETGLYLGALWDPGRCVPMLGYLLGCAQTLLWHVRFCEFQQPSHRTFVASP